jgi:hypothetical protein
MKEVKDGVTNKGKIVPRFQLRGWTSDDLRMFVESNDESKILAHKVKEQVS